MIAEVVVSALLILNEVVTPHLILKLCVHMVVMLIVPFAHAASAAGEEEPDDDVDRFGSFRQICSRWGSNDILQLSVLCSNGCGARQCLHLV